MRLLDHMRERMVAFQEETGHLYNLEATPAEGTTYRFAKEDRKRFPDILQAGTPRHALLHQLHPAAGGLHRRPVRGAGAPGELQRKYTGGTVLHLYMGERISSAEACKKLVRRALESFRLPYITITPTFSICPTHGYLAGEHTHPPPVLPRVPRSGAPGLRGVAPASWATTARVASFSIGKKGEHAERVPFREECATPRWSADDLAIAGFVPFVRRLAGKLVATLFLQGCPWNCGYCQNPDLIDPRIPGRSPGPRSGRPSKSGGLLDGVVFSGGEPTRQPALVDAVAEVRSLGFTAALHTSGAYPARLKKLLPGLGWLGLDIKAPPSLYAAVTGVEASADRAWESLDLVITSGIDYEVRVTVDPIVLGLPDIEEIVAEVARRGGRPPILQEVRAEGTRPEYAERLGRTKLSDVVPAGVLPGIERRVYLTPSEGGSGIREALIRHKSFDF